MYAYGTSAPLAGLGIGSRFVRAPSMVTAPAPTGQKTIMPIAGQPPVVFLTVIPTAAQLAAAGMRVMTAAEHARIDATKAAHKRARAAAQFPQYFTSYAGWLRQSAQLMLRRSINDIVVARRDNKLFENLAQMHAVWRRLNPDPVAVAAKLAAAKAKAAAAAAAHAKRYADLCNAIQMPPLSELGYDTLIYMRMTIGRDVDESASEKRDMRRRLAAKGKAIKLHALGLGPVPRGGMPTSGPILYWSPELAFKQEVCGSLTSAETARYRELSNQARAMLHKRAKDKRKNRLKKLVAIAAIVVGAVYLGPMISGALKGGGAAAASGTKAAAAKAIAVKSATAAKAIAVKTAAAKAAAIAAGKAALAAKAVGGAKMLASAAATSSAKTAGVKAIAAASAEKIASKAATAASLAEKASSTAGIIQTGQSLAEKAKELVPKVVDVANDARTLKAIANGEIPPPPITLEGDSFREYATSLAQQYLQKEIRDKQERLTQAQMEADNREIQIEIDRLQRETVERLRRQQIPPQQITQPLPAVAAAVDAGERAAPADMMKYALLAVPLMAALVMR